MKSAVIYSRVSSTGDRQNTDRQKADLERYASTNGLTIHKIFSEHMSGAKGDRPVLKECFEYAKDNSIDVILFSELSRLGRNVLNVLESVKWLADNGIDAYFDKEKINLLQDGKVSATTTILISCLGMCSEIERDNISFRLNSGRRRAIETGACVLGRKVGYRKPAQKKQEEYKIAIRCIKKGMTLNDTLAVCQQSGEKISLSTIRRLRKEIVG